MRRSTGTTLEALLESGEQATLEAWREEMNEHDKALDMERNNEHDVLMSLGFPAPGKRNDGHPAGQGLRKTQREREGKSESKSESKLPSSRRGMRRLRERLNARVHEVTTDERGAVTAEYALIIMAAVAFAGLLIAILRSDEVRAMLMNLVQTALGSAG